MRIKRIHAHALRVFAGALAVLLAASVSPSDAAVYSYDFGASCSTMTLSGRTITCNDGTTIALHSSLMPGCRQFALSPEPGGYTLECATPNATGLWWRSDENGRGTWVSHQGDTIFAVDFGYDALGAPRWRTLIGAGAGDGSFAGNVYTTGGPSFSAATFDGHTVGTYPAGQGFIAVDDADHLRVDFAEGRMRALVKQQFGALPSCSFASIADQATSTNYTDLWWTPAEPGWGLNLAHQGDTIFAAWFTYGQDGTPLWLVATTIKSGAATYKGDLYRAVGPAGAAMQAAAVGTATLTFADGNNATFEYAVQLAGMSTATTGVKPITRETFVAPGTTCH
jgi:hypothetical protein